MISLAAALGEPEFRKEILKLLEEEKQAIIDIRKTPKGQTIFQGIVAGTYS